MNIDALGHFREKFWPSIRRKLQSVDLHVVGSAPTPEVRRLVSAAGWVLHPDAPDEEVDQLFASATASVLPFPYSTGAKLKMLTSIAHGVPFLGTKTLIGSISNMPRGCLISDDADEWADHVLSLFTSYDPQLGQTLRDIASEYSWDAVADRLAVDLHTLS